MHVRRNKDGKFEFMTDEGWFYFDPMILVWIGVSFLMICLGVFLLTLAGYVYSGHELPGMHGDSQTLTIQVK